jgi:hypothetical protein
VLLLSLFWSSTTGPSVSTRSINTLFWPPTNKYLWRILKRQNRME